MKDQDHPHPPVEPERSTVRFNATKHGILSVSPVIPFFEDEDDWIAFRDSIFDEQKPQGGLQHALVDRIAALLWRIMRVLRYERDVITGSLLDLRRDMDTSHPMAAAEDAEGLTPERREEMHRWAMYRLLPGEDYLNKIMRYETRLHRHLLQTLHQLQSLRAAPVPPRHRTDIEHTEIRRIGVRSPRLRSPAPHH